MHKTTIWLLAALVALGAAAPVGAVTDAWLLSNLPSRARGHQLPTWQIFRGRSGTSVNWVTWEFNRRFAVWDVNGDSNPAVSATLKDDLVLDRETGLVWARDASTSEFSLPWSLAILFGRLTDLGHRKGWRLPTVDEMAALLDTSTGGLASHHPFFNVPNEYYWTCTTQENNGFDAWMVNPVTGDVSWHTKETNNHRFWPVRGGSGQTTDKW